MWTFLLLLHLIVTFAPPDTAAVLGRIRTSTELMDSRPDSSLALADEALALAIRTGFREGEAYARSRRGIALHVTGQAGGYPELEKALALFHTLGNRTQYGWTLVNLANLDSDRGDHVAAAIRLQEAIDLFESIDSKPGVAAALLNLGEIRLELDQLPEAMEITRRAFTLYDFLDIPREKSMALLRMGTLETLMGRPADALPLLRQAGEIAESRQDLRTLGNVLEWRGQANNRLARYGPALEAYRQSLAVREQIDDRIGEVGSRVGIAKMLLRNGDSAGATTFAAQAYQDAARLDLPKLRAKSARILYETHRERGRWASAMAYLEEYQRLQAELLSVEKATAVANLEAVSQLRGKELEIHALESQRSLERTVLALVVALLIVSILFMHLSFNSRKKAQDMAERLDRVGKQKDQVLSILSHDLRGPLVSMSSLIDLLDLEGLTADDWRIMKPSMMRQFQGTSETLQDLLVWAKGEFEGANPHVQTHSLRDAVLVSEELLDVVARQKGVVIRNDVSEDALVRCERSHLLTIIRNLATNAVKFSHPGQTVTIQDGITDGMRVLTVRDEGIGMPPHLRDTLFEQAGTTRSGTAGEGGSGLGLMFVRDLVNRNGGRILVESTPGKGSAFSVALPMG